MITTINNKHNKLNFSSEREQGQACLNSAEHEKNQGRKVLNVPNLRFPEFQGEWITYKIKNVLRIGNGRDYKHLNNGGIPVFGTGGYMTSVDECLYDGETTFIGRKGSINKPFYYNGKFWTVDTLFYTHSFNGITPKFTYCLFQTINWLKYNEASGVPSLSKDTIEKIKIKIPGLEEQNKIAKLMFALDERIATQNKIIEDLKKLKSAIINYAINSLDTDFAKFSSLYEMAGEGGTPTTSNASFYDNGKIPFIKIDDLKQKYLIENNDFITELGLQKSSAWLVPTSSILFSNGATIGEITITTYPVCTKQGILGIVPKQNIDVEYLYYFMSSSYFKKAVSRIVTEGTMKTAYLKDINNILCPIPTKEEQQEIAKIPSALNSKIDTEKSILKLFITQKQHLLHQMFI